MKLLAAATLMLGLGLGASARAMSPADIYARLAPSVWKVQTFDEDGLPLALGSAVVVAPEKLVTNCHVLQRARRVVVKHEKQTFDARLALWDPARDVCQIEVAGLTAPTVVMADDAGLHVGQPVYTLGNPRGLDLTMSEGLLSSIRRNDKEQIVLLQTSASFSLGSSGGGLFDDQARLIGLTTLVVAGAKPGEAQNLNFAIPVEWVQQLPDRHTRLSAAASAASAPAPSSVEAAIAQLMPAAAKPAPRPRAIDIADDTQLPFSNEKMREAYRQFLARPMPRAFVIGENGASNATWRNPGEQAPNGLADAGQRAMLTCQRQSATRCVLYAVDDRVVYDPAKR